MKTTLLKSLEKFAKILFKNKAKNKQVVNFEFEASSTFDNTAEIQQTSDITYRVYDWDRTDTNGQKRELHTKLAEQATKEFDTNGKSNYKLKQDNTANLASCEYFTTNILDFSKSQEKSYTHLDSFIIFMCVEGSASISVDGFTETLTTGETILLPANTNKVLFNTNNAKLLEVYV
jgi:mannose-6-phosphate isomerase